MRNEINLLPPKKSQGKENKQARTLRLVSIGILFLVTSLSVVAFLLTVFSPLPGLKKEEEAASRELDAYQIKAVRYLVANKRLSEIQSFLQKRYKYPEVLSSMESTNDENITFTGISMSNQSVTLNASSQSLESLNSIFIDLSRKSENEKLFSNFIVSGLTYSSTDNLYKVGLNVTLR